RQGRRRRWPKYWDGRPGFSTPARASSAGTKPRAEYEPRVLRGPAHRLLDRASRSRGRGTAACKNRAACRRVESEKSSYRRRAARALGNHSSAVEYGAIHASDRPTFHRGKIHPATISGYTI